MDLFDLKLFELERLLKFCCILGFGGGIGGLIMWLKLGMVWLYMFMLLYVLNVEEWGWFEFIGDMFVYIGLVDGW